MISGPACVKAACKHFDEIDPCCQFHQLLLFGYYYKKMDRFLITLESAFSHKMVKLLAMIAIEIVTKNKSGELCENSTEVTGAMCPIRQEEVKDLSVKRY